MLAHSEGMEPQYFLQLAHGLCSREHNQWNVPAHVMWPDGPRRGRIREVGCFYAT
jgi:hypothetical protein